jgi:biotin transport system substrate-specific component
MSHHSNVVLDKPIEQPARGLLAQALWITGFALATAFGARLEIPHEPVPYTLQTMVVLLAGALLGARNGALSQLFYLGLGIAGAPVFAGGAFGYAVLLGPTGGYLLAFPVAAALTGYLLRERHTLLWTLTAMVSGTLLIFAAGTAHLYAFYLHDGKVAFTSGFLIFTWWDMIKVGAASMIYHEVGKRWPRIP